MQLPDLKRITALRSSLAAGRIPFFAVKDDGCYLSLDGLGPRKIVTDLHVLPGSFNPLHEGHQYLMSQMQKLAEEDGLGFALSAYEMSIKRRNVGLTTKEPLPACEILERLKEFPDGSIVIITNADFFVKKAGALREWNVIFHVGYDTARRLLADDEALGVEGIDAQFRVYERDGLNLKDLPCKPRNMDAGTVETPSRLFGISSTKIREARALQGAGGLGVIVGRFQTPRLDEGHVELISRVVRQHPHTAIALSVSPAKLSKNDPLSYELRAQMIKDAFPSVDVFPMKEFMVDDDWSKALDASVLEMANGQSITLYGAAGTFIDHYKGTFEATELEPIPGLRGVARHDCGPVSVRHTEDFRAGVMYAIQEKYITGLPTADFAIVRDNGDGTYDVACGYKPDEQWPRIAGGFFDPTKDTNYLDAMVREGEEETSYVAQVSDVEYVGSTVIDDWRYPGPDRVITSFGMTFYDGQQPLKASDDLDPIRGIVWIPSTELVEQLTSFHKPLGAMLVEHLARRTNAGSI